MKRKSSIMSPRPTSSRRHHRRRDDASDGGADITWRPRRDHNRLHHLAPQPRRTFPPPHRPPPHHPDPLRQQILHCHPIFHRRAEFHPPRQRISLQRHFISCTHSDSSLQ
ncbi:hypothetical protein ACS0TY_030835 [Phlomoides rotata]